MLDLRAIIKQREESSARFTKPILDPRTGEQKRDDTGAIIKFVPNSVRTKNPVNTSTQYKDDPRMKEQEDGALADHIAWQLKMTARAEQRSLLEIEVRYEDLKKKTYELAEHTATAWYTNAFYRGLILSSKLSKEDFVHLVTSKVIGGITEGQANIFGFKAEALPTDESVDFANLDGTHPMTQAEEPGTSQGSVSSQRTAANKFTEDYVRTRSVDMHALKRKFNVTDKSTYKHLLDQTRKVFSPVTFELWERMDEEDTLKKINAAQKLEFKSKSTTKATEATAMVLDEIDLANPPKELDDYVAKQMKKEITKLRRELVKSKRLNCSGDSGNQESTPTKNGTGSKKVRFEASTTDSTPAKKKKKKKKKKSGPPKDTQPPKSASRGGHKSGGKKGGAAKR